MPALKPARPLATRTCLAVSCLLAASLPAHAHDLLAGDPGPQNTQELLRAWSLEPGVIALLLPVAWLYARGLRRMRPAGSYARESVCFAVGWLTLAAALISPLHAWGQALFSAHMVQHEALMLVAAPFLVMGRPLVPMLCALPRPWASCLAGLWHSSRAHWWLGWLARPLGAWSVHALVLWAWHAPLLFAWTLRSKPIHSLQHVSFLGSALLFWWAVCHGPQRHRAYGTAVLYLFTTALHTSLLGVLLTLSKKPWYEPYLLTTAAWNLTPLEDQQLGGLIMWIPGGVVYLIAALALFALWLQQAGPRVAEPLPAAPSTGGNP
jgi:cytochrome c oxidase assembly factor CtaG